MKKKTHSVDPKKAASLMAIADQIDLSSVVQRYANKNNATLVRARAVATEMKRFLVLCAMNDKSYSIGGEVDEMWHTFILFTHRYGDFCTKVAGRFIHHVPSEDMQKAKPTASPQQKYQETLDDYSRAFARDPDASVWFIPSANPREKKQDPFPCEGGGCGGNNCVPFPPTCDREH